MSAFFDETRPGRRVAVGKATFDLPILYYRDDSFALFFHGDLERVEALMPSDRLRPVRVGPTRALVGIAAFNYLDTSIGPYGEVAVILPAVHGRLPALPVLPALLETRYPGLGMVVMHLPVTTQSARDAGRGVWGFTKFVADMHFERTPERISCRMSEQGEHILTLSVARRGLVVRDNRPLVTFSVKSGDLIRTEMPQRAVYRMSLRPRGSSVELGPHPMGRSIAELDLSRQPIQSRDFIERSCILPEGRVIERGVRALGGLAGLDREGDRTISYGDQAA